MAENLWGIRPPGQQAEKPASVPVDRKARERLMAAVEAKVAQGFQVESQKERYAVLVKRPRRYLGISLPSRPTRVIVSLDQRGYPTDRAS